MLVVGEGSIRDAITFLKTQKGKDLMADKPTDMEYKQLKKIYVVSLYDLEE
ncbi:MAG: hypothetical protein AAGA40_00335 [Cyanobacteria bacterium P01_E01_bin.45]